MFVKLGSRNRHQAYADSRTGSTDSCPFSPPPALPHSAPPPITTKPQELSWTKGKGGTRYSSRTMITSPTSAESILSSWKLLVTIRSCRRQRHPLLLVYDIARQVRRRAKRLLRRRSGLWSMICRFILFCSVHTACLNPCWGGGARGGELISDSHAHCTLPLRCKITPRH